MKVLQLFYIYRNYSRCTLLFENNVYQEIPFIIFPPFSLGGVFFVLFFCFFVFFLKGQYLSKVSRIPSAVCTEWLQELFLENGSLRRHQRMKDDQQNFRNAAFGEFLKPLALPSPSRCGPSYGSCGAAQHGQGRSPSGAREALAGWAWLALVCSPYLLADLTHAGGNGPCVMGVFGG